MRDADGSRRFTEVLGRRRDAGVESDEELDITVTTLSKTK